MRQSFKGIRVGSSDPNRLKELREAHKEFEKMLADGWQVTNAKKAKRPRIQKIKVPRKVEVSIMNGLVKVIVDFTEWQAHGSVGTVVKEIY